MEQGELSRNEVDRISKTINHLHERFPSLNWKLVSVLEERFAITGGCEVGNGNSRLQVNLPIEEECDPSQYEYLEVMAGGLEMKEGVCLKSYEKIDDLIASAVIDIGSNDHIKTLFGVGE